MPLHRLARQQTVRTPRSEDPRRVLRPYVEEPRKSRLSPVFQPARGWWAKSVWHRVAWALTQVEAVYKEQGQVPARKAWQAKIENALVDALRISDWSLMKYVVVRKDEGDTPASEDAKRVDFILERVEFAIIIALLLALRTEAGQVGWLAVAGGRPFSQEGFDKLMAQSAALIEQVPETLKSIMRSMALDALSRARDQNEFLQLFRERWREFAATRAEMLTDTEWTRATSAAEVLAYDAIGITHGQWITASDDGVCQICLDNEDAGPIPIGEKFPDGSETPPAHPACRCSLAPAQEPT